MKDNMTKTDMTGCNGGTSLYCLHRSLTVFMATNEMVMFLGGLVLNVVMVFCLVLYGAGVMDCTVGGQIDTFRMIALVYGIINVLFYIYSMAMICEPEYCVYTYDERVERYGRYMAPLIVLFPLFAPHAIAIGLSLLVFAIYKGMNKVYCKLESKLLG